MSVEPPRPATPDEDALRQTRTSLPDVGSAKFQDSLSRLIGTVLADRYRVLELIGQGGMATVFLAQHVTISKQVAIKVLSPFLAAHEVYIQRFLQEAQSVSAIRHRNIVDINDFGHTDDNLPFFVMEYLDGEDLRSKLDREGRLPWAQARPLVMQICAAVEAAHAAGIIHRDIKADNCFLLDDGGGWPLIKVLDFGIAKVDSEALENTSLTSSGAILGTADYISPELAQSMPVDHRTDIYSLGVLLFRTLTGQLPFSEHGFMKMLNAHIQKPPPSLIAVAPSADIPPELEAIVLKALEKDPDKRFQTVAELSAALRAVVPIGATANDGFNAEPPAPATSPRALRDRAVSEFELAPTDAERANPWPALSAQQVGKAKTATPESFAATQPTPTPRHGPQTPAEALPDQAFSETVMPTATVAPLPDPSVTASTEAPRAERRRPGLPRSLLLALAGLALVGVAAAAWMLTRSDSEAPVEVDEELLRSFAPLPKAVTTPDNLLTADKVTLGRMLFYETRISRNHDISCNSCHDLARHGVDGQRFSVGHAGERSTRNSPTVYNAAGHFAQFWDGRSANVEAQATEPILNQSEMAMAAEQAVATLASIPQYVELFRRAFPDSPEPVSMANIGRALGAFERQLMTPSRWDRFLAGEQDALSNQEKKGFNVFVYTGCVTCHFGPYVGGTMFQRLGLIKAWPDSRDRGRFEVTKNDADWMVFKVPGLRNVTRTGPYFHDGSIASLPEAVRRMALHQLGKSLEDSDVDAIVAWLGALEGELPQAYITPPSLPPSTPSTPSPVAN